MIVKDSILYRFLCLKDIEHILSTVVEVENLLVVKIDLCSLYNLSMQHNIEIFYYSGSRMIGFLVRLPTVENYILVKRFFFFLM